MNTRHTHPSPPAGPFEAVNRRFMRLIGEEGGPLTRVWMLVAGFNFAVVVLSAIVQVQTNAPMLHELFTDPAALSQPVGTSGLIWVLYPLMFIVGAIYWASFRAVREVEDRRGNVTFAETIELIISRFLPTMVATLGFGLLVGLGMMCCILPGLVGMFFFYQAPYLVAEGMPVSQAFSESSERAKRHAPLVFLLIAISFIAGIGSGSLQFFALAAFEGVMGQSGIIVGSVVAWVMASIAGYFMWMYSGAVFITISKAEENMRPGLHLPLA